MGILGGVIMDAFIILILIFGIPSIFFSKTIVDYFRKKNDTCQENKVTYRYIIQLKDEAIGKINPNDLKDVGQFDVFGTSGAGLQGQSYLKQDAFKDYLCTKFSLASNLITIIDPSRFIRRY
jgi:hypothetical protein